MGFLATKEADITMRQRPHSSLRYFVVNHPWGECSFVGECERLLTLLGIEACCWCCIYSPAVCMKSLRVVFPWTRLDHCVCLLPWGTWPAQGAVTAGM